MSNYTNLQQRMSNLLEELDTATRAKEIIDQNKERIVDNNKYFIEDHDSYNDKKDKYKLFVGNINNEESKIRTFNDALESFISDLAAFETHFVVKGAKYVVNKESEVIFEYDNKLHPSDNDLDDPLRTIEKIPVDDPLTYLMSPKKSKGARRVN